MFLTLIVNEYSMSQDMQAYNNTLYSINAGSWCQSDSAEKMLAKALKLTHSTCEFTLINKNAPTLKPGRLVRENLSHPVERFLENLPVFETGKFALKVLAYLRFLRVLGRLGVFV